MNYRPQTTLHRVVAWLEKRFAQLLLIAAAFVILLAVGGLIAAGYDAVSKKSFSKDFDFWFWVVVTLLFPGAVFLVGSWWKDSVEDEIRERSKKGLVSLNDKENFHFVCWGLLFVAGILIYLWLGGS